MRKLLLLSLAGLMVLLGPASSAYAGVGGLRYRYDPADRPASNLDIEWTATASADRNSRFVVDFYNNITGNDIDISQNNYVGIKLDTKNDNRADREIRMYYDPARARFECAVLHWADRSPIGYRPLYSYDAGDDDLFCTVRTNWLNIRKEVRYLWAGFWFGIRDLAPNRGVYQGL
jgi:hypothetical protein